MGSPLSPFIWNLVFDPLLAAVEATPQAEAPTCVDEVACLCFGACHAACTQVFMMKAARSVGLHIEARRCRGALFIAPTA